MEYLDEVSALQRVPESEVEYKVVDPGAAGLADRLIGLLPEGRELTFYDASYPSPSDPGAYVSVRTFGDNLFFRRANTHWYSRWKKERRERLLEYLERSLPASEFVTLRPCAPGKPRFFGWLTP
jgi:hypothetical protein